MLRCLAIFLLSLIACVGTSIDCMAFYDASINVGSKGAPRWGDFYASSLDRTAPMYMRLQFEDYFTVSCLTSFNRVKVSEIYDWDKISSDPIYDFKVDLNTSKTTPVRIDLDWNDEDITLHQFNYDRIYAVQLLIDEELVGLCFFTGTGIRSGQFYFTYNTQENTATLCRQCNELGSGPHNMNCQIPSTVSLTSGTNTREFTVTDIANDVCFWFYKYETLFIPATVNTIGANCLKGLSNLKEIKFEDGAKDISIYPIQRESNGNIIYDSPFSDCPLEKVYIGRQFNVSDCFKGQEKLTDVEIGEYVRYIQDNAFNGCTSLTYLNIHEGLTSIGQNAFYYCNSIEKVSLPKSLKRIGSSAFMGCHSLKSIILPENISSLGYRANDLSDGPETVFKECSSLSDVICLYPASVGVPSVSSANHHILVPNADEYTWGEDLASVSVNHFEYTGEPKQIVFRPNYSEETAQLYGLSITMNNATHYIDAGSYSGFDNVVFTCSSWECSLKLPISLTITPAPLEISAPALTREYGQPNPEIELVYNGFKNNETEEVLSDKPSISLDASTNSPVGEYPIIVSGAEAKNYDISYNPGKLIITKANQSLTWNQTFDNVKIGDEIQLTAVSSSGLPIEYVSSNPDIILINGSYAEFIADGKAEITAKQTGNDNYLEAPLISKEIDVLPVEINEIIIDAEQITLSVGDSYQLTATINPDNATYPELLWRSENENIATVNDAGLVRAVGKGTTTIIVESVNNPNIKAECTVDVSINSGIEGVSSDGDIRIVVENKCLHIYNAPDNAVVNVYSSHGVLIYSGTETHIPLSSGLYIVKVGNSINKIAM